MERAPSLPTIKVKDKDWGNGAAIVKNADGSYTYDASERTENEDGTWTVKTDTQTLTEQEDGTWKLTGLEGSGSATADGGTSFVRNIEETYKADEVEVTDNGIDWSNAKKLPTASIDLAKVKAYAEENKDLLSCLVYKTAEFTPEKESGSIDMDYTFNSNDVIDRLSGETKNLVVFEVMFKGSIENASDETPVSIVASECDKDNEGQTVKLAPSTIGTTATDKSDGDHELMAGKDAVITDEVKYEGLIPGKEYTLHATLMDKKTGEPLKVADKGVTAELKFTPNSESGTVSINLGEFDATSLDGHTLVPAFRQCVQPLVQLGLVICEDGIYAIADWEFNQNVPAIDAMREGNRVRKASERARKNGKGTRQVKKDKVLAYLTEHPEATNTEVAEKTGVSRPSVIKYRKEYAPALPAPKGGKIVKDDGTKVDTVKIDGVKVDSFDSKVDVNFDVKVDSDFDTDFYTDADGKSAGRQSAQVENEAVKIASHPKNIDDRYKNTSTSTAIADGDGMTGSGIPTREEVRSHFAEMGFAVDPDRFFDVNEGRGWRTNSGKPVDDWKKLAAVWDRNEHPKATTPPARTEPKANAVGKIPSVEEVMAKWGCDRETAQGYIDENMY